MLKIDKLCFINEKQTYELVQRTEEVRKLLKGFIKYFQDSTILK